MTRTSFVSIVRHDHLADTMLVRARIRADISQIWPEAEVAATPHADYPFRAAISEASVAEALARLVHDIDYATNFKGGVKNPARHNAYVSVWSALRRLQEK